MLSKKENVILLKSSFPEIPKRDINACLRNNRKLAIMFILLLLFCIFQELYPLKRNKLWNRFVSERSWWIVDSLQPFSR